VRRVCLFLIIAVLLFSVAGCAGEDTPDTPSHDLPPPPDERIEPAAPFTPIAMPSPLDLSTSGLVKVPDPLSGDNPRYPEQRISVPSSGGQVCDSSLGTCSIRVTEAVNVRHEYSRFDPFNADQSLVMLLQLNEGSFAV
jgi:hypothetical protein